tara:strand:- start:91 stop:624 length:534 start_codon:yes stop_codon:yes gene_type:complete
MKTFKNFLKETKQGHALVVGGKVIARGSKSQLLKQVKKDGIKIDHKNNFLTYTGKEVGDSWKEEVEIDEGSVLDIKDVDNWIKEIEKGINAPWVDVRKSTLGGDKNVAIMVKLSLDAEKDWNNKILHNSRYAMIRFGVDGEMEMFAKGRGIKNMRKTKFKTAKDAISKINVWIKKVS